MSAERTKGPWHQTTEPDNLIVCDPEGGSIADCAPSGPWISFDEASANAAAIVRWENHFDDLVKALEAAEKAYKALVGRFGYEQYQALEDKATELRRAALAKIKP